MIGNVLKFLVVSFIKERVTRLIGTKEKESNMNGSKEWYASRGVWGSLVTIASLIVGLVGIDIDPATQAVLVDNVTAGAVAIGTVVGTVMSLIGRLKATKAIK